MAASFERKTGAQKDLAELCYVSALHQTARDVRKDGSIRDEDIALYLRSRHSVVVSEEEVRNYILPGLAGIGISTPCGSGGDGTSTCASASAGASTAASTKSKSGADANANANEMVGSNDDGAMDLAELTTLPRNTTSQLLQVVTTVTTTCSVTTKPSQWQRKRRWRTKYMQMRMQMHVQNPHPPATAQISLLPPSRSSSTTLVPSRETAPTAIPPWRLRPAHPGTAEDHPHDVWRGGTGRRRPGDRGNVALLASSEPPVVVEGEVECFPEFSNKNNKSSSEIRLDPATFSRVLTADLGLLRSADQNRISTNYQDVLDAAVEGGEDDGGVAVMTKGEEDVEAGSNSSSAEPSYFDLNRFRFTTSSIDFAGGRYASKAMVALLWASFIMFVFAELVVGGDLSSEVVTYILFIENNPCRYVAFADSIGNPPLSYNHTFRDGTTYDDWVEDYTESFGLIFHRRLIPLACVRNYLTLKCAILSKIMSPATLSKRSYQALLTVLTLRMPT